MADRNPIPLIPINEVLAVLQGRPPGPGFEEKLDRFLRHGTEEFVLLAQKPVLDSYEKDQLKILVQGLQAALQLRHDMKVGRG